jgi:hypothetical protein
MLYGIDIAIQKLRPNATFSLYNKTFEDWWDPQDLPPPSWEEIMFVFEQDKQKAEMFLDKNPS